MTRRISAGGFLLLERFLRLVEQPHVLDRDHRLVGERLTSAIWRGVNGRTSRRYSTMAPITSPSLIIGTVR